MNNNKPASSLPVQFYLFQGGIIFGYFALRLMIFGTSWWCLTITASTAELGSVLSATVFLELISGPLAAPLGDRFGSRLISLTFAVQVTCLLGLASAAILFKSFSFLVAVPLLVAAQLADAARDPLADSLLPQLIGSDGLVDGERIRRELGTASRILGPVVGGTVTTLLGASATLYLAAAAFCMGGYMCLISRAGRISHIADKDASPSHAIILSAWSHELLDGFRSVIAIKTELAIAFGNAFLMVGVSTFMLIALPQLAHDTNGAWVMGAVDGAFGCGVFVSATIVVKRLNQHIGRYKSIVTGLFFHVAAFVILLLGLKLMAALLVGGFLLGFASVPVATNLTALRLRATPANYRTRVIANTMFISSIFLPAALYFAGAASHTWGVKTLLTGLFPCILAGALIIPFAPHLRILLNEEKTDEKLEYVALFPNAFNGNERNAT